MARPFGTLGDFFPDTDIRCRIRGCENVCHFSGEEVLHNVASGRNPRPEKMCDACFELYQKLEDRHIPCARPGCGNTWVLNRFQQLEAMRQGRQIEAPKGFCPQCRQTMRDQGDLEVPCRMRGCTGSWTWPARERLLNPDASPPRRMCDSCFQKLRDLRDMEVPCRVRGCTGTWLWNRYQQLEHLLAGKPLDRPSRRMCAACFEAFAKLQDIQVPCRVRECPSTWTYTVYEQLERRLAEGEEGATPERMCPDCYAFYNSAVDRDIPCRNRGCTGTWVLTRATQLRLKIKRVTRTPARMCDACRDRLAALEDREIKCCVPGCSRTWGYRAVDQLRDHLAGRQEAPGRRCRECEAFLAEHQAVVLHCDYCGKDIQWSGYEQLLCERGTFQKPTRCPECTGQALALERPREPEKLEHHLVVRIPSAGRWHEDDLIRDWPPRMTHDVVDRVERADIRIVCIGDELTYSLDDLDQSWPHLLEKRLEEHFAPQRRVAVVNAGIAFCNTARGVVRIPRDIVPFSPHLVVFSFSLADARLYRHRDEREWRPVVSQEEALAAFERMAEKLRRLPCKSLYWTPHPIFPDWDDESTVPRGADREWAQAQTTALEQILRVARQCCIRYDIPTLDVRARFEVNGTRSARKWMSNWYLHNEVGSRNIATWIAEQILRDGLVPLTAHEPDAEEE
ncbi:MAG: SGNH/GDSL hydrolase family protein [Lentisphaeria bacterium]|nr:SGNH/GDSL hydrolase family protein [Lentisphaeria bacterium]